jgi:hypothetical protein
MIRRYIVINQQFAQAHEGYTRGNVTFNYAITLSGEYVCSENSLDEFPELFENSPYLFGLPVIELTIDDFPTQPL